MTTPPRTDGELDAALAALGAAAASTERMAGRWGDVLHGPGTA